MNGIIDGALAYVARNINKPIVIRTTQATIRQAYGQSATVTAPTVSGYKFVSWLFCQTSGWIGNVYVSSPQSENTSIWNSTYGQSSSSNGNVNCYALYMREDIA